MFSLGIDDAAVHSAGVSYLLAFGLEIGLPAIAEYPITLHSSDTWKRIRRVFPDAVWFRPSTHQPWVAFEFERFERGDENKIRDKVENLVLSYYQSGKCLELCVFIYWLRSSLAPRSMTPVFNTISKGFTYQGKPIPPPGCRFLLYKMVMTEIAIPTVNQSRMIRDKQTEYGDSTNTGLLVQEVRKINGNVL